jgi:hypothetical protein
MIGPTMTSTNQVDKEALERCLGIAQRDAGRAEQLQSMLKDTPRREVLEFAAYSCQIESLCLKPWESPPCIVDIDDPDDERDDVVNNATARSLLRRMLAAKISRYEPSPLQALKRKQRK